MRFMKRTIDDLPMVKASTLRAHGYIGPETKTTLIRFDDSGVEYQVGVTAKPLPCGGSVVAVHLPAVPWARAAASSARRPACLWQVRQGERVDLSFAVDAHREAPCGHSASAARPAE